MIARNSLHVLLSFYWQLFLPENEPSFNLPPSTDLHRARGGSDMPPFEKHPLQPRFCSLSAGYCQSMIQPAFAWFGRFSLS